MNKLLIIPTILTLAACATSVNNHLSVSDQNRVAANLPAITSGHGQLCIARVGDVYTCDKGLKFDFIADYDKKIGDIRTGNEYFCTNLTQGEHNIAGVAKSSVYYAGAAVPTESRVGEDVHIAAGTRIFMEIQCSNWGNGVQMVPVSTERGIIGIYHTDKYQKRYVK